MNQLTLSEACPGKCYTIQNIKKEARLSKRLSAMGLMCDSSIWICQNLPKQPVLIFARDTLIAIGREESKKITIGGPEHDSEIRQ